MADSSPAGQQLYARRTTRPGGPSVVLAGCGGGCEVTVDVGDPAGVIQRVASELHADVIVVGQSRHRWMHLLGSVPGRLARHAQQPVLIVP